MNYVEFYCTDVTTGSFLPATQHTVLKKQVNGETNEAKVYKALIGDSVHHVIPKFYGEVEQNNEGNWGLNIFFCFASAVRRMNIFRADKFCVSV